MNSESVNPMKALKAFPLNEMERFPEFVKRFFPKIYLAEEGETGGYQYQIIVLEKLYPLAREVKKAIMGRNEDSRLDTILPNLLDEINSILNKKNADKLTDCLQYFWINYHNFDPKLSFINSQIQLLGINLSVFVTTTFITLLVALINA